jgi:hypothetical protein
MTGNETSAIASLRATSSAQVSYSASWGNGGYATSYTILGTAPTTGSEGFISPDLGAADTPTKSGYTFKITATGADGPKDGGNTNTTTTAWMANGDPLTFGTTGTRHFVVGTGNTIWQDTSDTAFSAVPTEASGTIAPIQ